MRYSLRYVQNRSILIPLLRLTLPTEGFPWDDLRKILHGCQRMASVHSGEEILPKASIAWVGCTNVTDDEQTDDRRNCDSKDPNITWSRSDKNVVSSMNCQMSAIYYHSFNSCVGVEWLMACAKYTAVVYIRLGIINTKQFPTKRKKDELTTIDRS